MKSKFVSCLLVSSSLLLANNFHNKLIIPGVNINDPFWEFAGKKIHQKKDDSCLQLVKKWDVKINECWRNFQDKVKGEIRATPEQIDFYLNEQRFIDAYLNYSKHIRPDLMDENRSQDIEMNVLNFIVLKLNYLKFNKNIDIIFQDNAHLFTASFGTDQSGHSLILNANLYSSENIQDLYNAPNDKPVYHIEAPTHNYQSRTIERANLLHLGITQALSSATHQHDFFEKLLRIFTYNKKVTTKETQSYCTNYVYFLSFLESCLQSKNPLEAAIFLEPQLNNFNQEFTFLWRDFIDDLKNCYDPTDLEAYETLAREVRTAALYTQNDE